MGLAMRKQQQNTVGALGSFMLLATSVCAQGQQPAPAKPVAPAQPAAKAPAPVKQSAPTIAPAPTAPQPVIPPQPAVVVPVPPAELLWSVVLEKDPPAGLLTDSEFASQRSAVLTTNRVIAIFEVSSEVSHGGRPVSTYRLMTLDRATGEVKGQKDLQGQHLPSIFAADDDHVLLAQASVTRLNPDLSESGEKFAGTGHGDTAFLSPDGSIFAQASGTRTEFLDAHTLHFTGVHIKGPLPTAVSKRALVTNDSFWSHQFPQDTSFVALIDEHSPHLIYRGNCAGRPVFLSETKILSVGCAKATVFDSLGKVLKEFPLGLSFGWFAGVSRDGSRFALDSSDYPLTDPSFAATQLFTIYNADTYEAVALVKPETLPEARSWSAFSQDGHLFLTGNAKKLNLYKIP